MSPMRWRARSASLMTAVMVGSTTWFAGTGVQAQVPSLPEKQPNVLLIVTDDQRLDGTMAVLPKVEEWFGNGGTEFTRTYVTTPLCCPSRASIMTGRYAHNHRVETNGVDAVNSLDHRTTIASYFDRAGYSTAIFGKFFNKWPHTMAPPFYDEWAITNFKYYDSTFNVNGTPRTIRRYSTSYVSDKSVDFIERASAASNPWFLYIAPMAAHSPFEPAAKYRDAPVPPWNGNPAVSETNRKDKPLWVQAESTSLRQGKKLRRLQLRTLMSVDDLVDRVMLKLQELGEDSDTIAVFTSDNGYFWGEHGLDDKRGAYIPSIQVPLYLRWPTHVSAGATDDRIAANIDIAPTLLSAAGIDPSHSVDGRSLMSPGNRERLLIEYFQDEPPFDNVPRWAATFTPEYEYVEYFGKNGGLVFREYYDLVADPWQLVNLLKDGTSANDPPAATLKQLSEQLAQDVRCDAASCP